MQGPEIWLNQLSLTVACVVDPAKDAILDEAHRIFINFETYYLSSAAAWQTFSENPWQYSGLVTDPVSHERFQPDRSSPATQYEGRLFYFESGTNAEIFGKDPASRATPVVPYTGRM